MIISSIRGKHSKGSGGRECKSETAREGEARRGTRSPSSFIARPSRFSRTQNLLFFSFGTPGTQARLSLKQWKTEMFLFVTLRFLSNLCIILIASLFYFLHVSLVCFNVSGITELMKAFNHCFNKRRCLTVCTNLVHYFS